LHKPGWKEHQPGAGKERETTFRVSAGSGAGNPEGFRLDGLYFHRTEKSCPIIFESLTPEWVSDSGYCSKKIPLAGNQTVLNFVVYLDGQNITCHKTMNQANTY